MANIKITELNAAGSLAANDVLPVVDISTDETKKITSTNLFRTLPDGTAAAPALAFSSDQANGIYLAGTDTVGITTGGTQRVTVDASGNVVISGDLTVQGATTTVESTTVTIDDKNIELGSVASPSNTTADGGGITLKGASDKTIKWINSTGCWTFNQPTNFNDHVRIDSSGRLLVGTTTAGAYSNRKLTVATSSGTTALELRSATNGDSRIVFTDSTSSSDTGAYKGQILYDQSSDYMSFNTNGNNERLRIDSSGGLLVGTTAGAYKLVVSGGVATTGIVASILNPVSGGNSKIHFSDNATYNWTAGTVGNAFAITPTEASTSAGTPALFINSSGKVGISTTAPLIPIQLNSYGGLDGNDNQLIISNNTYYSSGDKAAKAGFSTRIDLTNQDGSIRFINTAASSSANAAITLQERLRITSDGKLGLGTTSPGKLLSLQDSTTPSLALYTGSTIRAELKGTSALTSLLSYSNSPITFNIGGSAETEALRIDGSGRVLLGTTTEGEATADNLTIADSGHCGITLRSGTSSVGTIFFSDGTSGAAEYQGYVQYDHSANYLKWATAGTERMRINSAGNVGIGVSSLSSSSRLTLLESAGNAQTLEIKGANSGGAGSQPGIKFTAFNGDNIGGIYADTNADAVRIQTGGSDRVIIDSSGRVGVGTSAPYNVLTGKSLSIGNGVGAAEVNFLSATNGYGSIYFGDGTSGNATYRGYLEYVHTDDSMRFGAAASERMRIDSSGNVGIGRTSASSMLDIQAASGRTQITLRNVGNTADASTFVAAEELTSGNADLILAARHSVRFFSNLNEKMRIDSSGRVAIGTTSALTGSTLTVAGNALAVTGQNTAHSANSIRIGEEGSGLAQIRCYGPDASTNGSLTLRVSRSDGSNSQDVTIDSSGRLLLGTTTEGLADGDNLTIADSGACGITLRSGSSSGGAIYFSDATSGSGEYAGFVEYLHSSNALRFASGGTERMRIDSSGHILFGTTTNGSTAVGTVIRSTGETLMTRDDGNSLLINRMSTDGILIDFRQNNTSEGSINVSGSSVTLVGAHLSRWSQLPGGVERIEILRGSVLSNLDEMCEWGEEDNEQLNRMKVSDVEGDKNVSGVFQSWDDDDNTYVNDFHCAMTGDFVIRIAQGTTVARGDLLMSAGDGTAKPQEDDIVRSKTIAKVTSTTVSTTYSDNSYCVPCVLMAC